MALTIASSVFLMAMGIWLGGVVFFTVFTAPVIFERLPRNQAADLISVIFPRYYNLGYFCGFLMLITGAYPIYVEPSLATWTSWGLALIGVGVSLYAGKVIMPRVKRLRLTAQSSLGTPEHAQNRDQYNRAHQLSFSLNALVLLILLAETIFYGYRVQDAFLGPA